MPVTDAFVQATLANLSAVRPVTGRKMFGGMGLYCDGVFFAVIDDDRLYFKVDEHNRAAYEGAGAAQWVIEGPSGGQMPYFEVPGGVLADPEELGRWIDAAVEVARRKKSKKK